MSNFSKAAALGSMLSLCFALSVAISAEPKGRQIDEIRNAVKSDSYVNPPIRKVEDHPAIADPISEEQRLESGIRGSNYGKDKTTYSETLMHQGGERDSGVIEFRTGGTSQRIEVNSIIPGADPTRAERLEKIQEDTFAPGEGRSAMDVLREATESETEREKTTHGVEKQALRTVESSAKKSVERERALRNDPNFWSLSNEAIEEGSTGSVLGETFADCQDQVHYEPIETEVGVPEEFVCERIVPPDEDVLCVREFLENPHQTITDDSKRALLNVAHGDDEEGELCRVERQIETDRELIRMHRAASLGVSVDDDDLMCRRYRWASQNVSEVEKQKVQTLPITEEMGGLSCTRKRWLHEANELVAGERTATLSLDDQTEGTACTISRIPSLEESVSVEVKDAILDINRQPNGGVVANRWFEVAEAQGSESQTHRGTLDLSDEAGGISCKRTITPTSGSEREQGEKTGFLSVDNQIDGSRYCSRTIWPQNQQVEDVKEHVGTLQISTESSGLSCTRSRWPSSQAGSSQQEQSATLSVSNEQSGEVCRRWREPSVSSGTGAIRYANTSASSTFSYVLPVTPGVNAISAFTSRVTNNPTGFLCFMTDVTQQPSSANGWTVRGTVVKEPESQCASLTQAQIQFSWREFEESLTWALRTSGNCNDQGTAACPVSWACPTRAPATINGIEVGVSDVNTLPVLYPGAPSVCLVGVLSRVCSTAPTSNDVVLNVPAGTTAIQGFTFTVNNPQSNVTVTLAVAPTLANGWRATFNVSRTGTAIANNPQIKISYTAVTNGVAIGVNDVGDCSDTGSASCPTSWSCKQQAPGTINGITLQPAMVSGLPALFPGASNICIVGELSRVCATGSTLTTIGIGHLMPAGTSVIVDFDWEVINPQNGVTVSLVSAPTLSNGWGAQFSVTKAPSVSNPAQPQIRLRWRIPRTELALTVRDEGNCQATGTASCPARWLCEGVAPKTINGVNVTAAMAGTVYPLFPGATRSNCTNAGLFANCQNGSADGSSIIDISDQIPAGVTEIYDVRFAVSNTQSGIAIALEQLPTLQNGWKAQFKVTRTDFSYVPEPPFVRLTWEVENSVVSYSVDDIGDCRDVGSESCPTAWACEQQAPAQVNGIWVNSATARTYGPLFNGAPDNCVIATLSRECSNGVTKVTSIGISSVLPPGTETIEAFTWSWDNRDGNISVELIASPSRQNGWHAEFRVRSQPGVVGPKPIITLRWNVPMSGRRLVVRESGNPNDPGDSFCPTSWSCTQEAPHGDITEAMVVNPLYPGAPALCVAAELRAQCSGEAFIETSVSIANEVGDAGSISDFAWEWTNEEISPNVRVEMLQPPMERNRWTARFRSFRSDWSAIPPQPEVRLSWNQRSMETSIGTSIAGDCDALPTPNCEMSWSCGLLAPATVMGLPVTVDDVIHLPPLYPNAEPTCLLGRLSRVCTGYAVTTSTISIADLIPDGTVGIEGFGFIVMNPQAGVEVRLVSQPTRLNEWVAEFSVRRLTWEDDLAPPIVRVYWQNQVSGLVRSVVEEGNCNDPGSRLCPTRWSCSLMAPAQVNGHDFTTEMTEGLPPLYLSISGSGAHPHCIAANLNRTCNGEASFGATISVAELIPEGVTEISDFAFEVQNPQPTLNVRLMTAPTLANGWMAYFEVVRNLTHGDDLPEAPLILVTFKVREISVVHEVRDEGVCTVEGSQACPATWSCETFAPAVVNDFEFTPEMVIGQPLLYDNADPLCVVADLRLECGGDGGGLSQTQIPIDDLLPEGTQEILNFEWVWENENDKYSVSLSAAPTLENGWVATFDVLRLAGWDEGSPKPQVVLKWIVLGSIEIDHDVVVIGDCEVSGDDTCPAQWQCLDTLPIVINGIEITQQMLIDMGVDELFPGEGMACMSALLMRVCPGDGTNRTEVSIAEKIPSGVTEIQDYRWSVSSGGAGYTVNEIQVPAHDNGWIAIFDVVKNPDPTIIHSPPEVLLEWKIEGQEVVIEIVETGDCTIQGDAFCAASWMCTAFAPGFEPDPGSGGGAGGSVGQLIVSVQAPVAPATTVDATVNITSRIPFGIEAIRNFGAVVVDPPGFNVSIKEEPSAQSNWRGEITIVRVGSRDVSEPPSEDGFNGMVHVKLSWLNGSSQGAHDPTNPGGGGVPVLFDGAPPGCTRAEMVYDCSGINNGQVCHETPQGTVCEEVEGGAFQGCAEFMQNEDCELDRIVCNEDGQLEPGGHCYIESRVYVCQTRLPFLDHQPINTTVCQGATTTCLSGECTSLDSRIEDYSPQSRARSYAIQAFNQNLATDYEIKRVGGGGGVPPIPIPPIGPPVAPQSAAVKSDEFPFPGDDFGSEGYDPWKLPDGYMTDEEAEAEMGPYTGIMPSGIESISFLKGKSQACMKALGGLMNCCTKNVKPDETPTMWWDNFATIMRQSFASQAACDVDVNTLGSFDGYGEGSTGEDLNQDFTSLFSRLAGGGSPITCGDGATMADVNNQYRADVNEKIKPDLNDWFCDEDEFELASQKEIGNCYYLGDYCQTSILGICIDKRQRHCCFNSPMTKMIRSHMHETGMLSMGSAKEPRCDGIDISTLADSNMSMDDMDLSELEGRMVAGGAIPSLEELMPGEGDDASLMNLLTGSDSAIGNADRMNVQDRTIDRLDLIDYSAGYDSQIDDVEHLLPDGASEELLTIGQVSFVTSSVEAKIRKVDRLFNVKIKRVGGEGAASVRVVLAGEGSSARCFTDEFKINSRSGVHYMDLTWGNRDTSQKQIPILIAANPSMGDDGYPVNPLDGFQCRLRIESLTEGLEIYPVGNFEMTVKPRYCFDPEQNLVVDC